MDFRLRLKARAPMFADENPDAAGGAAPSAEATPPDVSRETPPDEQRPDIERLLNWDPETDGEIPEDLQRIPVADVRDYVSQRAARIEAETEARVRDEAQRALERQRQQNEELAKAEEEIRWAEELDQRRSSDDPEVRAKANVEYDGNRDRFINALAQRARLRQSEEVSRAVESYISPQIAQLRDQGHDALVQSFGERAKATGGNLLLAAIEYGKELGVAEGRAQGAEEAEMRLRAEEGTQYPSPSGAGTGGSPYSNIDRSQVGAGAAMIRTALSSKN